MIATATAIESLWVPWEMGYADAALGEASVAVLPIDKDDRSWTGTEFVGLYQTVEQAKGGGLGVFPAGKSNGSTLAAWLAKGV